jgi:chemosensory pili system protein ChpA (sensor histidine kinase/response regulator)
MAMDRFSIDDVRDSFAADMAAKIRRVQEAGHALLLAPSLQVPAAIDPVDGIPGFEAVSQACHAIFGTSALVDARSLAESARLLEILTSVGKGTLAELEKQARLSRSLGEACVEGADALARMLALELEHRSQEAWELALEFREHMGRWEEAREAIAEGAPPQEFAFEEEPAPLAPPPARHQETETAASAPVDHLEFSFEEETPPSGDEAVDPLSAELVEVFRQEAREGMVPLEAALRRLAADPRDREAVVGLERLYHTFKGSAATVGLARVAAMAVDLQDTLQDTLERNLDLGPGFSREELQDLVTRTNSLLAAADLPPVDPWRAEERASEETSRELSSEAAPTSDAVGVPPREASTPEPPLREPVAMAVPPEVLEAFEEEMAELLAAIEAQVLALEESQQPQAVLLDLFRTYHTLKGSLHTVGLAPLGRVIHRIEDFIEELSAAPILPPLRHLATLLLNVQDDLRRGLRQSREGFVETRLAEIEAEIASVRSGGPRSLEMRLPSPPPSSSVAAPSVPLPSGARSGGGPSSASPRRRFTDRALADDRRSVRVTSERLDGLMNLTGELVVGRSRLLRRVARMRGMQRLLTLGHQRLTSTVDRFRERHEFSLASTGTSGATGREAAWSGFSALEMDSYGEVNILARHVGAIADDVATVQSQIHELLNQFADDAAAFGVIVSGLQGEITRARMVPVEDLFARLRLPVRDAAQREGKSVRVTTSGEDVDLDKTIMDKLYAPLLHVVRNAVSHGIEPVERRGAAGKDPVGTIGLSARQESGLIVLEVSDDGGGLDLARLREAAVNLGLLPAETALDNPAVADALFLPGVSTRASASDTAGRGMGGDVIRREIEKLGGDIRVKTTQGLGTRFTITLPLTLAITRALLLRNAGQIFAVPLAFAERLLDLSEVPVVESAGVRRLKLGDAYVPLVSLDAALHRAERRAPPGGVAVLLRAGERRMAVSVDRLLGQEEIVVKSLGELLSGHPLLSGITLSGDGELILILDVPGLLDPRGAGATASADLGELPTGAPRVLFADDSLSVRKVAEKLLTELGAEVTLAVDGQEALEILGRRSFDVVFTDLEMPRLHGYELIQAISASATLRHLPVVVVTSRSGQKHRDEAYALGARDYLTKPFDRKGLAEALRKWAPRGRR